MLDKAKSFREAANIAAHYCSLRASCFHKEFPGYKLIKSNMSWIIVLTCQNTKWIENQGQMTLDDAAEASAKDGDELTESPWIHKSLNKAKESGILSVAS